MAKHTVTATPATREEWTAALACDHATFFQRPEWYEAMRPYLRKATVEAWSLRVAGASVVFPLFRRRRRFARGPPNLGNAVGTYGGPIGDALDAAQSLAVARWVKHNLAPLRIRANIHDPARGSLWDAEFAGRMTETQLIDLGDRESPTAGLRRNHKRSIRAAEEAGVTVRLGRVADLDRYQEMYEATLTRWGDAAPKRPYRRSLFERLVTLDAARFFIAEQDGLPIGGMINFVHGRHVSNWHLATSDEGEALKVGPSLQIAGITGAMEEGRETYDFLTSGDKTGVRHFKQGFKTRQVDHPLVTYDPWWVP